MIMSSDVNMYVKVSFLFWRRSNLSIFTIRKTERKQHKRRRNYKFRL